MADQLVDKQALEKEVTCPFCLNIFKEPKKLACDHVYCKNCLKVLAVDGTISCPECHIVNYIPNVNDFPNAFYISRQVEAFKEAQNIADNATQTCMVHKAQLLALYCETCKTVVCRDCVIMTKEHAQHKVDYIENITRKYRENHKKWLQMTEEFQKLLSQVELVVSAAESISASEETTNLKKIECAFIDLQKTLENCKQKMIKQLSQSYQSALNTTLESKHQIAELRTETTRVRTQVEAALEHGGDNEVLFTHGDEIDHNVKKLQRQLMELSLKAKLVLPVPEIMSSEMLEKLLEKSNILYLPADPTKSRIVEIPKVAKLGQYCTLAVKLLDSRGNLCLKGSQEIKAELHSVRDHSTASAAIIQRHSPYNISISFMSLKRGRNEASVTVRGCHIRNSPHTINFLKPLSQFNRPVTQTGSLERPAGLTSCGNGLLAVEYSRNRIRKYDTTLEMNAESAIGQDKLKGPISLTTDRQMNVYVSTVQDHKVHKFKSNGEFIKSTGTKGTLPGKFNFPMGLRTNSREELFVCDSRNSRIQVFDLELKFKQMFGEQGARKCYFTFPTDVDFDSSDNVYVCDCHDHQIKVYSPDGRFIRSIGHNFRSAELQLPLNLCIFNDHLYVTQTKKNHVTVCKTTGELVKRFGQRVLQQLEGIAVDMDGYVYISSHYSKIFVF